MKHTFKLLCLFLIAIFVFVGCNESTDQPDTSEPVSDSTPDSTDTPDAEDRSDTEDTSAGEDDEPNFDPSEDPRYGTAVNIDCDAILYMYKANGGNLDNLEQKCIDWFNNRYADCGISDILYNVDTVVPTESREEKCDWYLRTEENGQPVDYTDDELCRVGYEVYMEGDVDPYEVWINLCYENGINPWLSFRMNDVHYANEELGHNDFFYKAKENGWFIGDSRASFWRNNENTAGSRNWYPYAYNYAIPEVREYFTVYIDEMLGKYDVYGIELDWQRTIWCFPEDSKDNCQYMDLLMEEINRIVAKYEAQYGHEIKIMARIARDIDDNMYFGFDVRSWAEKDWIDVIVPSSYWGSTDSAMPIAEWKEELAEYEKIEIYTGFESGTINNDLTHTWESLAGFTSMYLQQGADKIYLYNLFGISKANYEVCASLENALKIYKRSYLVTWGNTYPDIGGVEIYDPLPLRLKKGEESDPIVLAHGYLNTTKEAYLYIGFQTSDLDKLEASNLIVKYNGVECEYKGTTPRSFVRGQPNFGLILSFCIPREAWKTSTSAEITVQSDSGYIVNFVELMNGQPNIG